jgi:hypothetical protein
LAQVVLVRLVRLRQAEPTAAFRQLPSLVELSTPQTAVVAVLAEAMLAQAAALAVVVKVNLAQPQARLHPVATAVVLALSLHDEVVVVVDVEQTAHLAHPAATAVTEPHTPFLVHRLPTQVAVVVVLNLPLAALAAQVVAALLAAQQQATAVTAQPT